MNTIEPFPVAFDQAEVDASNFDILGCIRDRVNAQIAAEREAVLYSALVKAGVEAPIHPPSLTGQLVALREHNGCTSYYLNGQRLVTFRPVEVDVADGVYRARQWYEAR